MRHKTLFLPDRMIAEINGTRGQLHWGENARLLLAEALENPRERRFALLLDIAERLGFSEADLGAMIEERKTR